MTVIATARLLRTDSANGYMSPRSARRALLNFLHYGVNHSVRLASTLRIFCFAGCALCDIRLLLAPFGLSLGGDGMGRGITPAGRIFCQVSGMGGPRPVLTLWKAAAVEGAILGAVVKGRGSLFGMLPVGVFREVLWPWVKTTIMCREERQVQQTQWIEEGNVDMNGSSESSDESDSEEEEDEWEEDYLNQEQVEEDEDDSDEDDENDGDEAFMNEAVVNAEV